MVLRYEARSRYCAGTAGSDDDGACPVFVSSSRLAGASVTEGHISTITDSIILLRYVELHGQMRRGLTVLDMHGSTMRKQFAKLPKINDPVSTSAK